MRFGAIVLVLLLWACAASYASAQSKWVLVPVGMEGRKPPETTVLEQALLAQDAPVLPNPQAAVRVESKDSSDGTAVADGELERLLKALGEGARELGAPGGRGAAARKDFRRRLETEPATVMDYLRREPERSQMLFDACIAAAWLAHKAEGVKQARQQLRLCVHTFPGSKPSSAPKALASLFEEVAGEVENEPHGRLEVRGRDGCLVRLNGSACGRVPLNVDVRLAPVRVQVECDDGVVGRVHAVTVQPGVNRVYIEPRLDAALRTGDGLQLIVQSATNAELAQLGETLGALLELRVLLLIPEQAGHVRILATHPPDDLGTFFPLLSAQERLLAVMRREALPASPKPAAKPLRAAVRLEEPPPSKTAAADSTPLPLTPPRGATKPAIWPSIVAGAGVAVGLAGITASWVFYAQRIALRDGWGTLSFADRDRFLDAGTASWVFSGAGNLLFASAEYALLPTARGVPLLAWAVGGGGVVLGVIGAIAAFVQRECSLPSAACTGFASDPLFGQLLMLHSVPLLAVPVNYWLRTVLDAPVRVELGLNGSLQLVGRF